MTVIWSNHWYLMKMNTAMWKPLEVYEILFLIRLLRHIWLLYPACHGLHLVQMFAIQIPQTGSLHLTQTVAVRFRLHLAFTWQFTLFPSFPGATSTGGSSFDLAAIASASNCSSNLCRNGRLCIVLPVTFLKIIHAFTTARSNMLQNTANVQRLHPAFVDICLHIESSISTPHLLAL